MANENTKLEVLDVQGLDDIVSSLKDGSLVVGKAGSVDADGINGMIPLSKLPAEVLGRGKTVATDVERLALTSAQVQNGEIIKVASTGRMYLVSDATKLGTSNAAGAFIPFGDSVSEAALAQTNAEVARIDSVMQEGLNKRYTIQETDSKVQNAIVGLALQVDENYVSKEVGKGLSTHDFTTLLKQKLDGLTNYDDTALVSALADLRSLLDAYLPLTGGTMKGNVTMQAEQMSATRTGLVRCIGYSNYDGTSDAKIGAYYSQGNKFEHIFIGWGDIPWTLADCLSISSDRFTYKNQKIWHAGNDGSESGLDADLLDGKQPDELNVGSADNAAALNGKDGAWFRNNALMFTVVKAASNGGQTVDATADAAEGG
ncbi:MAG: hypothetical protein K2F87_03265, partial [Muribaculaceae bacterium]|nr:hypothetical protein [Muribaculaceae bacterium]